MKKPDDAKLAEDLRMAETLDTLGAKINKRIEDGFTAVAVQFAEQRAYTEFAYARLEKAMMGRLLELETAMTGRHEGLEKAMTGRFDSLESKLDQVLAILPIPRKRNRQ
jgi:hypothetical protein